MHAVLKPRLNVTIWPNLQILTLINGDRIPLTNSMSLLFEVRYRREGEKETERGTDRERERDGEGLGTYQTQIRDDFPRWAIGLI